MKETREALDLAARQFLADRREVRTIAARAARSVRAEGCRRLAVCWRAHWWRGFDYGTRWAMHWRMDSLGNIPSNPTAERLRREARNIARYSREPVRPSWCGREDAEADRKAYAGALARVVRRAAELVASGE